MLLLIGVSLLITVLEQLQDRRHALAALVAFGTRRQTLGWSVLWQTLVPITLGMTLAVTAGLALGTTLLGVVDRPVSIELVPVLVMVLAGGGVALLVTLAALPLLWRLTRPTGLRAE